ncbi:MAG TPA: calcium-translocating P-type ATPase, SERCA-type [Spirochaetia bacterium]|nr:calcium-translocating P-type ATPase, SERCA-type [Spirochaetia bacterium]
MHQMKSSPHTLSSEEVLQHFDVEPEEGLSDDDASRRLDEFGPNELEEKGRPGIVQLLIGQFDNFLILILVGASIVSFLVGEPIDAAAILVIVVLNAVMGVVQEYKAEQALAALKKMSAPEVAVRRGGQRRTIDLKQVVPGDLVMLSAGASVPADLRLVDAVNLRIDEAALTGESVPVQKRSRETFEEKAPLGDRANMAYKGTSIAYGRGTGVVVATGMQTEMGRIADMIQSYEDEETPLQRRLSQLGKWLGIISLGICGLIFVYGVIRDTDPLLIFGEGLGAYLSQYQDNVVELFMTAVSLAIAAVPEGLPAVVTICLALGMQRMVRRHALIRKLPAVETLGTATVICSDKTGTLTQNQMTVVEIWAAGQTVEVSGQGYDPEGSFEIDGQEIDPASDDHLATLLRAGMLCNDASLRRDDEGEYTITGDPTEGAFVVAARKAGVNGDDLAKSWARLDEFPFTSSRKRMSTVHRVPEGESLPGGGSRDVVFMKGAPDVVLEYCPRMVDGESIVNLDDEGRDEVLDQNTGMAKRALRVLAVAFKPISSEPEEDAEAQDVESDMVFLGLVGMIDPARPEATEAVATAKKAGIRSVMVTGDYRETAAAIARENGILRENGRALTGAEIDEYSDEELAREAEETDVYARVSPEHKVRILEALKTRGHVAAMTGDGVNDAPALKRADIGVAMGITGTDVSKQTSEMVLTDDNFASIVSAVEEGRVIYSNIRKFVFYLISCNIGEILIIFVAMLAGLAIPLTPIMILWLNLVTDGAPALALGVEPGDPDIMDRPPRPPSEPIINAEMRIGLVVQAVVMSAAVLGVYLLALEQYPGNLPVARTIAFSTLVLSELWRAFTARSERMSVFRIGFLTNRWMLAAVMSSVLFLLAVVYVPFLQPVFDTAALSLTDWLELLPFTLAASIAAELTKIGLRRRSQTFFRSARKGVQDE